MAAQKKLQELFHDTLKDIYFAEKKILTALPKMAKAAQAPELKRPSKSTRPRPKPTLSGWKKSSRRSMPRHAARPAKPSWASLRKARK